MGYHHVALATARLQDTHAFYTEAMGFDLVKTVVNPTPEGGWAKHVFYSTDDAGTGAPGMLAFWDLHGDYPRVDGAMSGAVGLPEWVNHLAFHAVDEAHFDACRKRWLDLGPEVRGRKVTAHLQRVPAEAALRILAEEAGYVLRRDNGTLVITTP